MIVEPILQYYWHWASRAFSRTFIKIEGTIIIFSLIGGAVVQMTDWHWIANVVMFGFPLAVLFIIILVGLLKAPYDMHVEDKKIAAAKIAELEKQLAATRQPPLQPPDKLQQIRAALIAHADAATGTFNFDTASAWLAEAQSLIKALRIRNDPLRDDCIPLNSNERDNIKRWRSAVARLRAAAINLEMSDLK